MTELTNDMINLLIEIFRTPFLWPSLGLVTAISLFISPVLYNGDYRMAIKSIVVIGGYAIFSAMLIAFHFEYILGCGYPCWIRPVIFLILVAKAYALGLFLGVYIHNKSNKKINI